jgi:hypothetical protein
VHTQDALAAADAHDDSKNAERSTETGGPFRVLWGGSWGLAADGFTGDPWAVDLGARSLACVQLEP